MFMMLIPLSSHYLLADQEGGYTYEEDMEQWPNPNKLTWDSVLSY